MNKSTLSILKELKPGDSVEFGINSMFSVKTAASNINTLRGFRALSTQVDRDRGIIIVKSNPSKQ